MSKMKYPYYIIPDIEAFPNASGEERINLIRHIAACVGDEATLRTLLGIDPEEFSRFYPDMIPPELSTEATISTFINRFSSKDKAEVKEVDEIIQAPAVDYVSMIEDETQENEMPEDETSDAISAFLNSVPAKTPRKKSPVAEPEPSSEPVAAEPQPNPELSEELFKMMVKNKNYKKALEIITELSLNNPKKSVYFAYQIRFIKKLIKNENAGLRSKA